MDKISENNCYDIFIKKYLETNNVITAITHVESLISAEVKENKYTSIKDNGYTYILYGLMADNFPIDEFNKLLEFKGQYSDANYCRFTDSYNDYTLWDVERSPTGQYSLKEKDDISFHESMGNAFLTRYGVGDQFQKNIQDCINNNPDDDLGDMESEILRYSVPSIKPHAVKYLKSLIHKVSDSDIMRFHESRIITNMLTTLFLNYYYLHDNMVDGLKDSEQTQTINIKTDPRLEKNELSQQDVDVLESTIKHTVDILKAMSENSVFSFRKPRYHNNLHMNMVSFVSEMSGYNEYTKGRLIFSFIDMLEDTFPGFKDKFIENMVDIKNPLIDREVGDNSPPQINIMYGSSYFIDYIGIDRFVEHLRKTYATALDMLLEWKPDANKYDGDAGASSSIEVYLQNCDMSKLDFNKILDMAEPDFIMWQKKNFISLLLLERAFLNNSNITLSTKNAEDILKIITDDYIDILISKETEKPAFHISSKDFESIKSKLEQIVISDALKNPVNNLKKRPKHV